MKGIDISNLNGTVDISAVKNSGYGFVISKITEGSTFIDSYGSRNVSNTKANGLIAGAYHFARFRDKATAVREANFFKQNCPSNVDFVVLDFEQQCSGDMTEACIAFLNIISSIASALIYCNPNYINLHLNSNITKYPLWIAHYGVSSPSTPKWGTYAIWQYSESGRVSGVNGNVDLNVSGPSFNFKNNTGTTVKNSSIIRLQQELNSMINAGLVVDGIIGPATIAAIRRFQSIMGLNVDGIAGIMTWAAINEIRSYPTDGVKYPHYEYATRWIQWRVGAAIDGIFGSGTENKVKVFQRNINSAHGEKLAVDGIVGKETWRCMFKY
ncbi:GH25 family lysozyme [Clostridium neuense]|uniref:GH25 family lysozyme n=1 Tax=Clostridium neuense TaxID=1728934 RepID=A0ABW8TIS0_9CLOT